MGDIAMHSRPAIRRRCVLVICWLGACLANAPTLYAQLQFTEVMYEPGGDDNLWEWVEIRNTSAAAVDLDRWVFDDDDDNPVTDEAGNIKAVNGNTIVPAGGAAVLYAGSNLDFMPERFTAAWGGGINLIPVVGFTSLTATDAIGLWPSQDAHEADTIPMATVSPRRTFASASVTLNYTTDFPAVGGNSGRSIAWNGSGSTTSAANWVASVAGENGELGPLHEVVSMVTTIPDAPINDTADRGNPGILPAGPAAAGLLITEIMFAPASPAATVGWTSTDFEWVEVFNNTAAPINFGATAYVFDDFVGELAEPNITSGSLAGGTSGILFNAEQLTPDNMVTMWGAGKNYIPVTEWPALNNSGGDTIAIWDSIDDYNNEQIDELDHRAHALAAASVVYNTVAGQGWPTISSGSSIYLNDLSANPNDGASWTRAGSTGDNLATYNASPLNALLIDHPGGDVGSPGFVPGGSAAGLLGDYNGNNRVDAADYTVWRDRVGGSSLLNDASPGTIDVNDYNYWKAHFGESLPGSGGGVAAVPEPVSVVLLLIAALIHPSRRLRAIEERRLPRAR